MIAESYTTGKYEYPPSLPKAQDRAFKKTTDNASFAAFSMVVSVLNPIIGIPAFIWFGKEALQGFREFRRLNKLTPQK